MERIGAILTSLSWTAFSLSKGCRFFTKSTVWMVNAFPLLVCLLPLYVHVHFFPIRAFTFYYFRFSNLHWEHRNGSNSRSMNLKRRIEMHHIMKSENMDYSMIGLKHQAGIQNIAGIMQHIMDKNMKRFYHRGYILGKTLVHPSFQHNCAAMALNLFAYCDVKKLLPIL